VAKAGGGAPVLIDHRWSREEVFTVLREDLPKNTLVGLDLGIGLPHADCGAPLCRHARSRGKELDRRKCAWLHLNNV
jgi:hypothetical protein